MYVIRFVQVVCIISQTNKPNLQQYLSAIQLSTDNHQHLPNKRSFKLFEAGVGHFGSAVVIQLSLFDGENETKYLTITDTTPRYQGGDGVLQHCKSAV